MKRDDDPYHRLAVEVLLSAVQVVQAGPTKSQWIGGEGWFISPADATQAVKFLATATCFHELAEVEWLCDLSETQIRQLCRQSKSAPYVSPQQQRRRAKRTEETVV